MTKAKSLFAAFAWGVVSLALSGEASANGGVINFSGALVNPSCQLSLTMTPGLNGGPQGTVNAIQCGNAASTFSTTINVSRATASIAQGIGQISIQETEAGPVLEVSYN